MEAGTQSALIMIWALFWMLALSVMMVHPMFCATRVQIRRSLRLNLNRWRAARHRLRGRFRIRLGKTLLWLAKGLEQETQAPFWFRLVMKQSFNLVFMYVFWHLLCRQPMTWPYILGFLCTNWTTDAVKTWRKRRKQRLQETSPGEKTPIKSVQE